MAVVVVHEYKGNDGSSERKRRRNRFAGLVTYGLGIYALGNFIYFKHVAGIFVPDRDTDPVTGRERIRRRPERHVSKFNPQKMA